MRDNEDGKFTGDVLDAVIIYEKDEKRGRDYEKHHGPKYEASNEVYVEERGSSHDQADQLARTILDGNDKESTRKQLSKILKAGDPLIESRTVMIVLARRELTKLLKTMDSIDRMENTILDRIEQGVYDQSPTYELSALLQRLEQSMSRSITIVSKVLGDKDYEEFLLAYRDTVEDDSKENGMIGRVGRDKDSREKVRKAFLMAKQALIS